MSDLREDSIVDAVLMHYSLSRLDVPGADRLPVLLVSVSLAPILSFSIHANPRLVMPGTSGEWFPHGPRHQL